MRRKSGHLGLKPVTHHNHSDTPTATQIKINDMMNKSEPIRIIILGENKYINQFNIIAVPIDVPLP